MSLLNVIPSDRSDKTKYFATSLYIVGQYQIRSL